MKQAISAFLIQILLTMFAQSSAPADYDAVLDEAFEKGSAVFERVDFSLPDAGSCIFTLPPQDVLTEFGLDVPDEATLRRKLNTADTTVYSYSPDGTRAIGVISLGERYLPFAASPGRIASIFPSAERSAPDEFGLLGDYYKWFMVEQPDYHRMNLGADGAVWSPGGRYVFISNYANATARLENLYALPAIVDCLSGELFLLDSQVSNNVLQKGAVFALSGCFSPDEQYFYISYMGSKYEDSTYRLLRYDLETKECTQVGQDLNWAAPPSLFLTCKGELLCLESSYRSVEGPRLVFSPTDGSAVSCIDVPDSDVWHSRFLRYCAKTGMAIIEGESGLQRNIVNARAFKLIDTENVTNEMQDTVYYAISSPKTIEPIDSARRDEILSDLPANFSYMTGMGSVIHAEFSPGGRYAAILAGINNEEELINGTAYERDFIGALFLMRLSDGAVLRAEGIDFGAWREFYFSIAIEGIYPVFSWSEAGLLLYTDGVSLWKFK